MRALPSQARQKRTVAASRASASSTSSGAGQALGPRQGAVRLVTRLRGHAVPARGRPRFRARDPVRRRIVWPAPVASATCRSPSTSVHVACLAAVVEHGLADELDLDVSVEALDGADEHVVGVVVGRRARVRRDLVLVVPRSHRQRSTNDDPPARRLPGRLEDIRPRLVARAVGWSIANGASLNVPAPRSSRLPNTLGESKRGTHNQSTAPSGATSAPVWQIGDERVVGDRR